MLTAKGFAQSLLVELKKLDQRAQALKMESRGNKVIFGIEDEGEFVPILSLGAPTAKFNKMMLFVYHNGRWQPTFQKGTPEMLSQLLAGELSHVWTIPLSMVDWHPQ